MPKQISDPLGDDLIPTPERYSITSYGADYPADSLVKRMVSGAIYKPNFQRDYVWPHPQASRFIESLLLGLPVPGIFLATDAESGKLLILDGLQRLRTLEYFFQGMLPDDKPFRLKGVHEDFANRSYQDLEEPDRLRLNDYILHATVVRQDEPAQDQGSLYYLFERINTNGTPLSPQEIRTSIFNGKLIDLLAELNLHDSWRSAFGRPNKRMRDQEMILRFFAMLYARDQYSRPMKIFLNRFAGYNRNLSKVGKRELTNIFKDSIDLIIEAVGPSAFRPERTFNAAAFDSIMVAVAKRISGGSVPKPKTISNRIESLFTNPRYYIAVTQATADEVMVKERMKAAISALS